MTDEIEVIDSGPMPESIRNPIEWPEGSPQDGIAGEIVTLLAIHPKLLPDGMTIEQAVDCISLLDENQRRGYLTHLHKQLGIKPLRTMDEPDWMEAKGIRDYE